MRTFLTTTAGVFAGLLLFVLLAPFLLIGLIAAIAAAGAPEPIGDAVVLSLDLRGELTDQPDGAFGLSDENSIVDIVEALQRAETDGRVRGVLVRANAGGLPPAQAEEIQSALARFRSAGRFVVAHSQGFEGPSFSAYLATSSADEIWLQSTGAFVATGVSTHTPFFGGLLERVDAEAQFEQFEEYKSGPNTFTQTTYTDAHRESLTALLDDLFASSIRAAALARGVEPDALRALIEDGPHTAEAALELGLIDRLGHVAEAREHALERAGENAELVAFADYIDDAPHRPRAQNVIALVTGQGAVVTGERGSAFSNEDYLRSDTVAQAIIDASEDDDVRAIVLRIDSPGGSPAASDQIYDAVRRARAAGRPVVASFGSLAASGGYYLAAGADEIYAQPTTITGSIGVYGGKFVLDGAFDLIGVNFEPLAAGGDFTLAYSSSRPFTTEQRDAFRAMMADTYRDFMMTVAEGRGMDIADVREIARGRVWSGSQALERGLIDGVGGVRESIERARELAGLDPDAAVTVRRYPEPRSALEEIADFLGMSVGAVDTIARFEAVLSSPEIRMLIEASDADRARVSTRARLPRIE